MAVLYGTQSDGTLIPVQADNQGRLVASLAGADQNIQGNLVVTGDVQMSSLNSSYLGGFRNWIINGDFRVNARGGTRTPGINVYGFDRWKGNSQGLEQVVVDLPPGKYTLSWEGGGTGSVAGTSGSSGLSVDLVGGDTSVVVPSDAMNVQLEPGSVATPFEHRSEIIERDLCLHFYEKTGIIRLFPLIRADAGAGATYNTMEFSRKWTAPSVTGHGTWTTAPGYAGDPSFQNVTNSRLVIKGPDSAANTAVWLSGGWLELDSEVY